MRPDDAAEFAGAVLDVYDRAETWHSLRTAGLAFVERQYSWDAGLKLARQVLDIADQTWLHRARVNREAWLVRHRRKQESEGRIAQEQG